MEKDGPTKKIINKMEKFESMDNFINSQKEKILSLRKKKMKTQIIYRIIKEKENDEEKYSIYKFDKNEISKAKNDYKNKGENSIYKLSSKELNTKNYNDEELKYWLYSMNKTSMEDNMASIKEKILDNFSVNKINFLIKILIDVSQFNINHNNLEQLKTQIKYKYNACSLLINILYDTNEYKEIFIEHIKEIYDFIYILLNYYNKTKEISFLVLIANYQWAINNGIQDNLINTINKKFPEVNFPKLIQNVFNINNSEIYLNNIRMLNTFLEQQKDKKTIYQYKIFIMDIENIIYYSFQNNNVNLLKEAFFSLSLLLKSEANCKLLIENKQYIKLLSLIISSFNNNALSFCSCCLCRLVKSDDDNIINDNFQLSKSLLDIILNKKYVGKDVIKHTLKLLRLIINNKNGYNLLNYIINNSFQNFFICLQNLYFEEPHNLLVQSEIFSFYENFFICANNSLKTKLLENNLHIFTLNCLGSSYEEFLKDNKDNACYNKLIIKILNLLGTILNFGNNDLNIKISLKNCCEEKNIYYILTELNYSKNNVIQDLVDYLNTNFFDGYENDETCDNNDNYDE